MKLWIITKELKSSLPKGPGVYMFGDKNETPIYVGMSKNLYSRVNSYFGKQISGKTKRMVEGAKYLGVIQVESEFQALLLEAQLVKKYLPKYNSALRDDKSPLYVGIVREELPRIITLRKTQIDQYKLKKLYGPFVDGRKAKMVVKNLRRVFPFSQHRLGKRGCINSQIGLCKPCPSVIMNTEDNAKREQLKEKYWGNVRKVQGIFSGRLRGVKRELEKEIKELSKEEKYEEAKERLNQLRTLEYVMNKPMGVGIYLKNPNLIEEIRKKELNDLRRIISDFIKVSGLKRIECYDVAHLAGTYPTASMVVFIKGEAERSDYRHFRLGKSKKHSDISGIREVLQRRMRYFSGWGKPDLMIVDGGKGQVGEASKVLKGEVPVIGLAKRFETLIFKTESGFESVRLEDRPAKRLVQRLRDESHRFARRYHHKLVRRALLESGRHVDKKES